MAPILAAIPIIGGAAGTAGATSPIWGTIGTIASLAGTGLGVIGQMKQAESEAQVLEANAAAAKIEATSFQEQAKAETLKLSRERRQMIGQQAAIMGAAGVDISSGTPLDVMAETAGNFERDIEQLGYTGDVRAASKAYEASIYDWQASNKRRAGWIGAIGTAVSGIGSLAMAKSYGLPVYQ
jgi:hypothetical protein